VPNRWVKSMPSGVASIPCYNSLEGSTTLLRFLKVHNVLVCDALGTDTSFKTNSCILFSCLIFSQFIDFMLEVLEHDLHLVSLCMIDLSFGYFAISVLMPL
jgi:hypothetical protein